MKEKGITRRSLLKGLTAGAAATSVLALLPRGNGLPAVGAGTAHAMAKTMKTARAPDGLAEAAAAQEIIFNVKSAVSVNNPFAGISLPQHPYMATNNWNNGHCDSYCSESVGLAGPTSGRLRLRVAPSFGVTPIMGCNSENQMIGDTLYVYPDGSGAEYRLIVFEQDLAILAWRTIGSYVAGSFGGGYFYLNHENNAVTNANNVIACHPTASVAPNAPLDPLWTSADIVELVTGSAQGNWLYAVLPLWDDPDLYWCLLSGVYDPAARHLYSEAYMAVVQIVPDTGQPNGCTTTLLDAMRLPGQWNNNTFAVDEEGAYFVTNGVDDQGVSRLGSQLAVALDPRSGKITTRWAFDYKNSGIPKVGKGNIGSGTTPTLMNLEDGTKLVAIMDHALPQENLLVMDRKNGRLVAELPLFPKMRGGNEASLIGVRNWVSAENNFGHTTAGMLPQFVPNEPGVAMIQLQGSKGLKPDLVWEDTRTCSVGMNMLCRESGVIYAHTADWYDSESATQGATYGVAAIDAWDGRVIWRIPFGRGRPYVKDFGGQYFDRDGNLYIGAAGCLISIQNAEA